MRMIEEMRFRNTTNRFQKRLKEDIRKIRKSKNIIIPADKTRNMYEVSEQQYEKLLTNNITKNYKLTQPKTYNSINQEAKEIAQRMKIDDRVECMAKREAYITLKDHKLH